MFFNNEKGRSMVEMLGVLAIVGVLSVAGIMGYTVAMRKYRANEIAQAVSMLAVAAKTDNGGYGITADKGYTDLLEADRNPSGATSITAKSANDKFDNKINVVVETSELCKAVANIFGTSSSNPLYVSSSGCEDSPYTLEVTVK